VTAQAGRREEPETVYRKQIRCQGPSLETGEGFDLGAADRNRADTEGTSDANAAHPFQPLQLQPVMSQSAFMPRATDRLIHG
jgi:hypothetical protein